MEDTEAQFLITGPDTPAADREDHLSILRESWDRFGSRQEVDDSEWISDLGQYLTHLIDLRVSHVKEWLKSNTQRFQTKNANMEELRQSLNSAATALRDNVELCRSQCATCKLCCVQSRFHKGNHDCLTTHTCIHNCTFCDKELLAESICG